MIGIVLILFVFFIIISFPFYNLYCEREFTENIKKIISSISNSSFKKENFIKYMKSNKLKFFIYYISLIIFFICFSIGQGNNSYFLKNNYSFLTIIIKFLSIFSLILSIYIFTKNEKNFYSIVQFLFSLNLLFISMYLLHILPLFFYNESFDLFVLYILMIMNNFIFVIIFVFIFFIFIKSKFKLIQCNGL